MAIDRIGTAANANMLLAQIQKAELKLDANNKRVASGNVSDTYAGYGDKTAAMEAARSSAARADANLSAAQQAASRLDLQDVQLTQLGALMGEVRQTLTQASAQQDATSLMTQIEGYFNQAVEILNAKDANGYIYGGDQNQTPPVKVTQLSDLVNLPAISDAFANGSVKSTVRIGENQTVQVGVLASDVGTGLMSLFQQIAQFNAGPNGPFDTKTSPAQQNFLDSAVATSADVVADVNARTAANGINYQTVQKSMDQLKAFSTVYKGFVSSIQDVDISEAISQLNQNQVALQAAFQVASTLNQLSLLNYLPPN